MTARIGRLLRPVRAGEDKIAWHQHAVANSPEILTVTSPAFNDGDRIPRRYAGKGLGDNISPPLSWSGVPETTAELVLVVEDPDAPLPRPVTHLLVTGISPHIHTLREGALNLEPDGRTESPPLVFGKGSFNRRGYAGPRPIPGHGPHRYVFQLFALNRTIGLDATATIASTRAAMHGHVIARGRLTGTYER
ncbi:YbhB/YbcL family Raf kinase inhibitor-like protein [Mycobacterium sp. SVM_VP21]|nr:YbhB/YbcL family Raf kinase inhibitor-like protein [Mycobacterium sp. SVM_VP21]